MNIAEPLAVFVLGLRHGADPDHLAAIDNITRNAIVRQPVLSRFAGTLFALGHSIMVLAIAALVGTLGAHFARIGATIETIGTVISIVVLVAIALLNLQQLRAGRTPGVKTRLLPVPLRTATSTLAAIPIGLLFGFGFETSSQIATYTVAFSADAGLLGAVAIGATFCLGMIVSDTLDSVMVHRLVASRTPQARVMRRWTVSVSLVALVVAGYETVGLAGWHPPFDDIWVSATIVAFLVGMFVIVFVQTRTRLGVPLPATTLPHKETL